MNKSDREKLIKEEVAREILLELFFEKYKESYLSERPDIKNDTKDIGVEVTTSVVQSVHKKFALSKMLLEKRENQEFKLEDLKVMEKNNISLNKMENGEYLAAASYYGDINDLISIYNRKLINMGKIGYSIYNENNLYIDALYSERDEIEKFLNYLKYKQSTKYNLYFNYIYIYTDNAFEEFDVLEIYIENFEMIGYKLKNRTRKEIEAKVKSEFTSIKRK